jgi:hypothetical protein
MCLKLQEHLLNDTRYHNRHKVSNDDKKKRGSKGEGGIEIDLKLIAY